MILQFVHGNMVYIDDELIDRDIAALELEGKTGRYVDGVYTAPFPNLHGHLCCLRYNQQLKGENIEKVCLDVCPHNREKNPFAAGGLNEDCIELVFKGVSLDGENRYIEGLFVTDDFYDV